ncbi:MAG: HEAT repeat domain-containing protein [Chloroflexota bacterium]
MSTDPAKLIRSSNPKDRANGIKLVARRKDERALRILMQLSQNDEDPNVRQFARKGAAYVAKKLEEAGKLDDIADAAIVAEPEPEPEEEALLPEGEVEVSERNIERASSYVSAAFDQNMNEQKDKAIQSLSKAMQLNPNLRFDGYFTSVATSVTGLPAEEAFMTLYSDKKRKGALDKVKQGKMSASAAEHMQEAEKHTWGSLTLDLGIIGAVAFLGMLFAVLMLPFAINSRINTFESEIAASIEEAGGESELTPEASATIDTTRDNIELLREILGFIGLPLAGIMAVASLLGIVPGLVAFGATGHAIASAMGREGTMPYMIYNLVNAYRMPLFLIYALMILLPILIFIAGLPPRFALIGVTFILVIVILFLSFRVNSGIRQSYFGMNPIQASLVYFIAGIPYSLIVFGVAFVTGLVVSGMLAPVFELIPVEEITGL